MSRHRAATPHPSAGPRKDPPYAPARRLLGGYAVEWARAVLARAGAPRGEGPVVAVWDPFAGRDHPVAPPLCVGVVQGLARAAPGRPAGGVAAVLLEEDPAKVEWLRAALDGVEGGARSAVALHLREGDLAAASAPPRGPADATLVLLDPGSARRLDLESLRMALGDGPVDVLLRFPASELRRLAAYHGTPVADLPPYARRIVAGFSRLLADPRQEWIFRWTERLDARDPRGAERAVSELLAARLGAALGCAVRRVHLAVGSAGETECVLLATPEAERALLLNEVLHRARDEGWLPWPEEEGGLVRYPPRAELELFGRAGGSVVGRGRDVDLVALAHRIATRHAGRTLPLAEVLRELFDTEVFLDDVRRALAELRREGRALYRSLGAADAEVSFPQGAAAARRPRPARRSGRGGDRTLPLDLEIT